MSPFDQLIEQFAETVKELLSTLPAQQDEWLDIDGAGEHLKIPKGTIYNLVSSRKIPFHKVGASLRFRRSELDEWILSGEAAA